MKWRTWSILSVVVLMFGILPAAVLANGIYPVRLDLNSDGRVDQNDVDIVVKVFYGDLKSRYGIEARPIRTPNLVGDWFVGLDDLSYLVSHYRTTSMSPNWDVRCDLVPGGIIDEEDLCILEAAYGFKDPDVNGDGFVGWEDVNILKDYIATNSTVSSTYVIPWDQPGYAWVLYESSYIIRSFPIAKSGDGKSPYVCGIGVWPGERIIKVDVRFANGKHAGWVTTSGQWPHEP